MCTFNVHDTINNQSAQQRTRRIFIKTNEMLCLVHYLTLIIELTGERRSPRSVKRAKSTTFAAGLARGSISADDDDDDHAKVIMNRDNHLSYHHFSPAMHRETHTTNAPRREKDTPISLFAVTLFEHRFETRRTNDQISVLFSLSLSLVQTVTNYSSYVSRSIRTIEEGEEKAKFVE